jgi:lipid A 3-O-deacylase
LASVKIIGRSALWLCCLVLCASAAHAQRFEEGAQEFGVWASGGHSVPGGVTDASVVSAGGRWGYVLTGDHGPGPLRGRFEYAIDIVPMYLVLHQGTTYGGGFDPVVLKWNFGSSARMIPFAELGGGTLFSTHEVPASTSNVNFRTHIGLGMHLGNLGRSPFVITAQVRYEHISNAGLSSPNPGINSVQIRLGFSFLGCGGRGNCR